MAYRREKGILIRHGVWLLQQRKHPRLKRNPGSQAKYSKLAG
jgi:hypothetical protein